MQIKVGPLLIPVVEYDLLMEGEVQLHGQMNWIDFEIKLSNHNPPIYKFITLWHEVLHALNDTHGIKLQERQIATMATGIVQILQDNENMRVPPTQLLKETHDKVS